MIRCPKCGKASQNPKDKRHLYCGNCHQFHDTMIENPLPPIPAHLREKTLELLMKWRDEFKEGASIYKLSEMIFTVAEKQPEAAAFCRDMVAQSEANAKRLEKIIINYPRP